MQKMSHVCHNNLYTDTNNTNNLNGFINKKIINHFCCFKKNIEKVFENCISTFLPCKTKWKLSPNNLNWFRLKMIIYRNIEIKQVKNKIFKLPVNFKIENKTFSNYFSLLHFCLHTFCFYLPSPAANQTKRNRKFPAFDKYCITHGVLCSTLWTLNVYNNIH